MIDFTLGWRAVPGMFSPEDGAVVQAAVRAAPKGTAHVELGAWCGRSLAAACEALPDGVTVYSYDNYLDDSEAAHEAPITAKVAANLRDIVRDHFRAKRIFCVRMEASQVGYTGEPIHSLLVDDDHTAEQVEKNIGTWVPHMAQRSVILLHDYAHPPYGIKETCERLLPVFGYRYIRQVSGLGIWERQ